MRTDDHFIARTTQVVKMSLDNMLVNIRLGGQVKQFHLRDGTLMFLSVLHPLKNARVEPASSSRPVDVIKTTKLFMKPY
jgi:hypothetical protein